MRRADGQTIPLYSLPSARRSSLTTPATVGIGDKRVGPQTAMQLAAFRDDSRRMFDERGEQVEGSAREVHRSAATADDGENASSANPLNRTTREAAHGRDYIGDIRVPRAAPEYPPILPRLSAPVTRKLANTRQTCWPSSRQRRSLLVRTFNQKTRSLVRHSKTAFSTPR